MYVNKMLIFMTNHTERHILIKSENVPRDYAPTYIKGQQLVSFNSLQQPNFLHLKY